MLFGTRLHSHLIKCLTFPLSISYQEDGNLQPLLAASLVPGLSKVCSNTGVEP